MIENRPFSLFRKHLTGKYMCDSILITPCFFCKKKFYLLECKTKTWLSNLKRHTITTYLLEQLISSFLHIVCENPSTYLINSIKGLFWIIFIACFVLN